MKQTYRRYTKVYYRYKERLFPRWNFDAWSREFYSTVFRIRQKEPHAVSAALCAHHNLKYYDRD